MKSNELIGYIGTYTKGDSEGIYSFTLDTTNGKISSVKLAAKLDNPTYLAITKDNQHLYSVVKEDQSGGVAAYKIHNGELNAINQQISEGAPPCHVSIDSQISTVFSANYHKGTVESFLVDQTNRSLLPPSSVIALEGTDSDKQPHTHYAAPTPDEKHVVVVDLGIDTVFIFEIKEGKLTKKSSTTLKAGSGPRHLTFHPNGKFAYVMTEFSSEVIVLKYNETSPNLTPIQSISTIPMDFNENNQGSAIHISADGRFVYAGNRGHDSIALFEVNQESGELSFIEHTSTAGKWPRDFVLDPTEKFLVASNQNSSNLALFSRETNTGKLTLLQSDITVPDPVCVKFFNILE